MGEPLNNYSALVEAVRAMIGSPFSLSPKRITISTVCTPILAISMVFTLTYFVRIYKASPFSHSSHLSVGSSFFLLSRNIEFTIRILKMGLGSYIFPSMQWCTGIESHSICDNYHNYRRGKLQWPN